MGYAFISYSSKNQSTADAFRLMLHKNGVRTWMAPYDIPAGSEYAEVLYDALTGCACLVLLLTDVSQNSLWVKKEVNIAISNCKTVIPVKLEEMELNSAMKLYLNDQQIVPVRTLDENAEDVRKVLKSVLAIAGQTASAIPEEKPAAPKQSRLDLSEGVYEGDLVDGKRTGKGKLTRPNGDVYQGDFTDGKRTGKGKLTWANGDVYEGDFIDGKRTGKGKYTWANGDIYEGDFVDGKRHGRGICRWLGEGDRKGDTYEGDFINGQRTGQGKLTMACGSSYEGGFLNGERHGRGIFRCESYTYEGDFANDHMHGKGKMTCADGSVYEGDYWESARHGTGRLLLKDGDVYEGDFVKDRRTGKGKLTCANGDRYEGFFEDDAFQGKGKYIWADGQVFEGDFALNDVDGQGRMQWPNGDVYEGSCLGYFPDGRGKYTRQDGSVLEGVFEEGEFISGMERDASGKLIAIYDNGNRKSVQATQPVARQGRQVFSDGVYEGDLVNGQRTGKGKYTWGNGDVYEGDFMDGKRHGKGTYTWARGTVYEGDFWNGQRTGKGKLTRPGGDVYEGDFVNGKQHGMGKLSHVALMYGEESYVYEGPFVENKCIGKGKLTYPNGNVYEGDVVDGQRHGIGVFTWNAPARVIPRTRLVSMVPGAQAQWVGGETVWDTGYVYRGTYEKDQIQNGKVYDANGVLKITYVNGLPHYEE